MTVLASGTYSCHWSASRPTRAANPAVEGDATADVAVIGGGYTGLATAYHLKCAEPGLDVAILEAETTGYGASGRNAGFVMTLFGSSVGLMKLLHGNKRIREAHDYMVGAIDSLERMMSIGSRSATWLSYQRTGITPHKSSSVDRLPNTLRGTRLSVVVASDISRVIALARHENGSEQRKAEEIVRNL